jgi:hypothetical protein
VASQDGFWVLRTTKVPNLDNVVSGRSSQDVFSGRMEENLTDPARTSIYPGDGIKVPWSPVLLTPSFESIRFDFPDKDFTIFAAGCDDRVVEGRPIGVEDGSCVTSGERDDVWEFAGKVVWEWAEGRREW